MRRTLANLRSSFDWAWLDVVCQYRRSRIGPFWEAINVAVMVAGLSMVSAGLFGGSIYDRIGYIGLGIIVWSLISSTIMDGCSTFVRNIAQIHSTNINVDLYIGRTVFKVFITFAHQLVLYAVGLLFGFISLGWISLLAVPGLLLILLNAFWVVTALGFVCSRYRDLEPIIRNLLQLAFLVTPVFWSDQQMVGYRHFIVDYNPFYHFIAIVRMPLLDQMPQTSSYLVVLAITAAGYALAYIIYKSMRRQLAFFV